MGHRCTQLYPRTTKSHEYAICMGHQRLPSPCFVCDISNISQNSTLLSSFQCEAKSTTAARIQATVENAAFQTNKIMVDGLASILGAQVKNNVATFTNILKQNFTSENSLICATKIRNSQDVNITVNNSSAAVSAISQTAMQNAKLGCLQTVTSDVSMTGELSNTTTQSLDQTITSPLSFLEGIFKWIAIGLAAVVGGVLLLLALPMLLSSSFKNKLKRGAGV